MNEQDEKQGTPLAPNREKRGVNPYEIMPYHTDKDNIAQAPAAEAGVILKHPHSWLICGKSGSGKTQTILNLLKKAHFYGSRPDPVRPELRGTKYGRGYFDHIFVWSETAECGDDLYKQIEDQVPPNHIYRPDEKGIKRLEKIADIQMRLIKEADGDISKVPRLLCLFDDFANCEKFLKSRIYLLCHIANRHFNMSCWSAVQSYMKSPRSCRIQVHGVIFYHGATIGEMERLAKEHTPPGHKIKHMLEIIEYATKKNHDFLFINKQAKNQRTAYRHGFGHVINLIH